MITIQKAISFHSNYSLVLKKIKLTSNKALHFLDHRTDNRRRLDDIPGAREMEQPAKRYLCNNKRKLKLYIAK